MESPARPCTFVLGGAKISDAFLMMETVLQSGAADRCLTGGLVGNLLLLAKGEAVGSGTAELIRTLGYDSLLPKAKALLERYAGKIDLPTDLAWVEDGQRHEALLGALPEAAAARDIGTETARHYEQVIRDSATVFVNGPMGVFEEEPTALGTKTVWTALGDTAGYTVVGGGDSITAAAKFGQTERMDYICTGGGALIRFLSGEELPVVKALREAPAGRQKGEVSV